MTPAAPLLAVENLSTAFHMRHATLRAVDGVSFSLKEGRILAVVGESGSGKTVTALSIMGLIDPPGRVDPESSIVFDGRDLVGCDEKTLRSIRGKEISMIFQEPTAALNPLQHIGQQIIEVLRLHEATSHAEERGRVIDMLRRVGIPGPEQRMRDFPHQLSEGMQQRVMIAMALICRPRVLIADEPTTALDVTIQAQILELIDALREQFQMSIMLITHDLGVVAEMADDVVVMYAGRVVEQGTTDEVFNRPQHPYTEALLESIPVIGMAQDEPLRVIRGIVPSPADWPQGCRFSPRCDYTFEQCSKDPPLFERDGRRSACWLRSEWAHTQPEGPSR